MNITERFLTYVSFDTQSDSSSSTIPSTQKQLLLADYLVEELKQLNITNASRDNTSCVYARIPASSCDSRPGIALIAHMDTAEEMSGASIIPRIIHDYDGSDILLNAEKEIITKISDFPHLSNYKGQDLIVTDGTTLLGADDKAGIAEIMCLIEYLNHHPDIPHPDISILFTPDEEIGRSSSYVDLRKLNAAYGYTIDGGALGEFSYETFHAASAIVTLHGVTAHPGYGKGVLKNALLAAIEYQSMLPLKEIPACTEGREGFFHLHHMSGDAEQAQMQFLIRDHDHQRFLERRQLIENVAQSLNEVWGENTAEVTIEDTYQNMYEILQHHPDVIKHVLEAMAATSVTPVIQAIRGGTDGSRLSYMGLPCPNICTGGQQGHGRHEFVSIQAMEKVVEILICLVQICAGHTPQRPL